MGVVDKFGQYLFALLRYITMGLEHKGIEINPKILYLFWIQIFGKNEFLPYDTTSLLFGY